MYRLTLINTVYIEFNTVVHTALIVYITTVYKIVTLFSKANGLSYV